MASAWEEVKRLAADFQRAQLTSSVQRLSERNCVEIVKKLLEEKLIEVIFTVDGKEYITPKHLVKEVKDELIVHRGRIYLVELAQLLSVDFSHIEAKASELAKTEQGIKLVLGQLINSDYLDHLAEEIDEKLQQSGQITIGELTKLYDLPADFLEEEVNLRLGTIIHGQADQYDPRTIFTEAYIAQHKYHIRGVLSAITRPIQLTNFINQYGFPERLFHSVIEELIQDKRLAGSVSGGRAERSSYIPSIYAKSQNEWVDSFYTQNGYLEYDSLVRLGIQDPKNHIKKRYKDQSLMFLSSGCIGGAIVEQIEAAVDEALTSGSWVDVMPLVPSVFTVEDVQHVLNSVLKVKFKQNAPIHTFIHTVVFSDSFLQKSLEPFNTLITEKAKEDVAKGKFLSNLQTTKSSSGKGEKQESRTKEERRKRAAAGKSGGGTQGRETKTKAVKKKYKPGDDSESEEEYMGPSLSKQGELEFLTVREIEEKLISLPILHECSEDLLLELAQYIYRPLTKKYQEEVKSAFLSSSAASSSTRKKTHGELQDRLNTMFGEVHVFNKGVKVFHEDVQSQLTKHLLKTICTDMVNTVVNYLAIEHRVYAEKDAPTIFTSEKRLKLISSLPENLKDPLQKLHNSVGGKSVDDFLIQMDDILGPGICDIVVKKMDKKRERQLIQTHRQELISQLAECSDPALCLHLAVLLIFQLQTSFMLHASGKFVPQIISFLQLKIPEELYKVLIDCQESVVKQLTKGSDEEKEEVQARLKELVPRVKEVATTYKKVAEGSA
ncbi:UFM1 specific ligase 1 isoform X1 [Tachypleus tridentatus]|uniref:UFM1 specific ligase 1 isoform X1 n=1 Tax=Tachypleus tridentatus TaxID=6853 RepID=UPI003FD1B94A